MFDQPSILPNISRKFHLKVLTESCIKIPLHIGYSYNLATGEKETVFNYSNEKRLGISPVFANDNYYIYCYEMPTDEIIMGDPVTELITVVVNRENGNEIVLNK